MAGRRLPEFDISILARMVKRARLLWRLLHDERISPWIKAIPVAILLYILSPIDLVPDLLLGLGQLDDIVAILLGLKLFLDMCSPKVVEQHWHALTSKASSSYVDADYRIIEEDED